MVHWKATKGGKSQFIDSRVAMRYVHQLRVVEDPRNANIHIYISGAHS